MECSNSSSDLLSEVTIKQQNVFNDDSFNKKQEEFIENEIKS